METITTVDEVEAERQSILEKLSRESAIFKAINARVNRAEGLDAHLNNQKSMSLRYVDRLLDRYNVIGLESIPTMKDPEYPDDETTTGGWEHDCRETE